MRVLLFLLYCFIFYLGCFGIMAQGVLSGTVVDEDAHEPVAGVLVRNLTRLEADATDRRASVSTDYLGKYKIEVSAEDKLEFSFIGFETKKVVVQESQTVLDVILHLSSQELEEVEVVDTGFGKQAKDSFNGSYEQIKMDDVAIAGEPDVLKSLDGRVSGLLIEQTTATFGSIGNIKIRGSTTIHGSDIPLFMVDGIQWAPPVELTDRLIASGDASSIFTNPIAGLNPADIEEITILKDAAAVAQYGAEGKNGVIVISTKTGDKNARLSLEYGSSFKTSAPMSYNDFDFMNSREEVEVYRELVEKGVLGLESASLDTHGAIGKMYFAAVNRDIPLGPNGGINEVYLSRYENANTNWFNYLFTTQLQQNHNIAVSGSSSKANYRASIGIIRNPGNTPVDKTNRYNFNTSTNFGIAKRVRFTGKFFISLRDQRTANQINPYQYATTTSRAITPYDETDQLEFFRKNKRPFNVIHELDNNYRDNNGVEITFNFNISGSYKNMRYSSTFGHRRTSTRTEHIIKEFAHGTAQVDDDDDDDDDDETPNTGSNAFTTDERRSFDFNNRISTNFAYPKNQGQPDHQIGLTLNQTYTFKKGSKVEQTIRNFLYGGGGVVNTEDPGEYYKLITQPDTGNLGISITGNYNYKQFLRATLVGRYDFTSTLGQTQTSLPTWNISYTLDPMNIPAVQSLFVDFGLDAVFTTLTIGGTYGITANPPRTDDFTAAAFIENRDRYKQKGLGIRWLADEGLTWEKTTELNQRVNTTLFGGKVALDMSYYVKLSFDLLGEINSNGVGGFAKKQGNYADLRSTGLELSCNVPKVFSYEAFRIGLRFNFTTNRNVITRLDEPPNPHQALNNPRGVQVEGRPKDALYILRFAGLNNLGIPMYYDPSGVPNLFLPPNTQAHFNRWVEYVGTREPIIFGGFSPKFIYGKWQLNAHLTFKFGHKVKINPVFTNVNQDTDALPRFLINRWATPGDEANTNIPTIRGSQHPYANETTDLLYRSLNSSQLGIADGSHIRLRSISISYRFGSELKKMFGTKFPIARGNLSFGIDNVLLVYSNQRELKGKDPEYINHVGGDINSVSRPPQRGYTLSLNLSFQ